MRSYLRLAILPAAVLLAAAGPALAATTWEVYVGRGGNNFVDEASGTSTTTIHVGDTVTWVWESEMSHSVTSGTCTSGGGGGIYGGGGGDDCTDAQTWPSTNLHGAGYTFSQTFSTPGTYPYYCAAHQSAMKGKIVVATATAGGGVPCVVNPQTLCLNGGRFEVTTEYQTSTSSGHGTGVKLTDDSGYFWFFTDTNIELVVKVLSFCFAPFNSYAVFSAGLTDQGVTLTVRDTQTGAVYPNDSPLTSPTTIYVTQPATGAFPNSCP